MHYGGTRPVAAAAVRSEQAPFFFSELGPVREQRSPLYSCIRDLNEHRSDVAQRGFRLSSGQQPGLGGRLRAFFDSAATFHVHKSETDGR